MIDRDSRDLARYRDMLQRALRSLSLHPDELLLICDALQNTLIDVSTARQLPHEVLAAIRYGQLDEKRHVDAQALIAKLTAYNDLQRMALVDAAERVMEKPAQQWEEEWQALGMGVPQQTGDLSGGGQVGTDAAWAARVNAEAAPAQRHLLRPDVVWAEIRTGIEPNLLLYTGTAWLWWDAKQTAWLPAPWEELAARYPLLPSQAIRSIATRAGADTQVVQAAAEALMRQSCVVLFPKRQYALPDGTMLIARWDGDAQWWFDLPGAGETVVTVDQHTGVLCAELRSELGMGSQRRWRGGLFTLGDIRPVPNPTTS